MSKTPWTPGPWRVDPRYPGDVQTADSRFEICTPWHVEMTGHACAPQGEPISNETAKANACLIAAAPEMAEFAEKVVSISNGGVDTVAFLVALNRLAKEGAALLARIRGETP